MPSHVWGFVHDAIEGVRDPGPVSVEADGHLVTSDPHSYEFSNCAITVKPLGTWFIE